MLFKLLKTIHPLIALLLGLLLAGFNALQISESALGVTDISSDELELVGKQRTSGHIWEQWGLAATQGLGKLWIS